MKRIADTAYVVSVHDHHPQGTLLINLKWEGNHDLSAFDLDRLGEVVHSEAETQNSGWVIIEPYNRLNAHPEELLPGFGSAILEPSSLNISAGDTVPLRKKTLAVSKRPIDLVCFLRSVIVCAKGGHLVTIARCFAEELAKCCHRSGTRTQPR